MGEARGSLQYLSCLALCSGVVATFLFLSFMIRLLLKRIVITMGRAIIGRTINTMPATISSVSLLLEEYTVTRIPAKKKKTEKTICLTLKALITTSADDIFKYFSLSSKDKRNELKCRLLQFLFGAG